MSEKRKEEVIKNLTRTIEQEKEKVNGGNSKTIEDLEAKLQSILNGTNKGIKKRR